MNKIRLTKGKYALVDDEDFDFLSQWKWHYSISKKGYQGYAARRQKDGSIYMHRVLIGAKKGEETDHINRNKLDNRRRNLRITTHAANVHNAKLRKTNTSGFKGVQWHKQRQRWAAFIKVNYKQVYLGLFDSRKEAARAYRQAALQRYG